jgi:hypothetical protein
VVYCRTVLKLSCHFILGAVVVLVKTDESKTINRGQKFVFPAYILHC